MSTIKAYLKSLVTEQEKQLAKREQSKELQLKLEKLREKSTRRRPNRRSLTCPSTAKKKRREEKRRRRWPCMRRSWKGKRSPQRKKLGKNPDVDTSFLPDQDREEEENSKQEKIKSEEIEITFSYWAGSGHQQTVKMERGNTMQLFLQKALEILHEDFSKLRSARVEHLIFCDFIITKVRGKNWPLFNFDLHDDGRLLIDATVEKYESHAGKVVLRSWYEKNKHIFPVICWEPYDPEKKWDKYKIQIQ
uniref:FAM50A/XAP5 C-terminal domain-containing protein n=1 Tax=Urocitellus parryii TaxID=9999 RepID=A0A8D2GKE6_UROPR